MTDYPIEHVDEIIYVGRRPFATAKDVDFVASRGFRSVIVLNERSALTTSAVNFADLCLSKHIQYISANVPMTALVELADGHVEKFEQDFNEAKFDKVVSLLDVAPRPTLVVSFAPSSNQAALAVVYAYVATRQTKVHGVKKLTADMRAFVEGYVETKLSRIMNRLPVVKYEGDIWAAAQPSAEEFRRFAALGAKSVLNIRDRSEAGKVGLGVLLTEPELCRDLNLDYFAVPVLNANDDTIKTSVDAVRDALKIAPKPVVFHCASRQRIDKLAAALGLKLAPPPSAAPAATAQPQIPK